MAAPSYQTYPRIQSTTPNSVILFQENPLTVPYDTAKISLSWKAWIFDEMKNSFADELSSFYFKGYFLLKKLVFNRIKIEFSGNIHCMWYNSLI